MRLKALGIQIRIHFYMSYYPKQNNHMTSEIAQKKYHFEQIQNI